MAGTAQKLGYRNVRGFFFQGFEPALGGSYANLIATVLNSDQPSEIYRMLGAVPALKEWIGERKAQGLDPFELTILNRKFQSTIPVHKDDLMMDKTGQVRSRLSDQGARAAELPEQLISEVLIANGNAYDGSALYADRSALKTGGRKNNLLTKVTAAADARVVTSAEMQDMIFDAITNILGRLDTQGQPMNGGAKRFAVMFPIEYMKSVNGALRNDFTSAGVSNGLLAAVGAGKFGIDEIPNPRLTSPSSTSGLIYVFRVDTSGRAVIFQARGIPNFEELGEGSDHRFKTGEHLFGAEWDGNAVVGMPEMTARVEFKNA